MKKKIVSCLMVALMVVSMAGCGNESDKTNEAKTTLSGAYHFSITTFAPNGNNSGDGVASELYDQLYSMNDDGELIMEAAESAEQIDSSHIRVVLRKGIVDTNGNELTGSDVLFSIELAQNGTSGYPGAAKYVDIANSVLEDDYTVNIALITPCNFQINALSMVNLVSEKSYNESTDGMALTPVGSGPYVLDEYVSGSYVKLKANEEYWGEKPEIKEIKINFVLEASQRTNALATNEVDFATYLPAVDYDYISDMEGKVVKTYTNMGTAGFIYNCGSESICNDINVRKAISYASNNELMTQTAYNGMAQEALSCVATDFVDYEDSWTEIFDGNYRYDIEKAKECIEQAGIPEGTTIKIISSGNEIYTAIGEVLQANLAEIGLQAELYSYPDTLVDVILNQPNDWDIALNEWTNFPARSALATLNTFLVASNFPRMDGELLETVSTQVQSAMGATEESEKSVAMEELMGTLHDELPWYGANYLENIYAWDEDLNFASVSDTAFMPSYHAMSWN